MKLGFLYAGQGSQHPGMGADLYDTYPVFRRVFEEASVDFDLKEVCFEDQNEVLTQTRYTQPCMVAFAVGMTSVLAQKGIVPSVVSGLSLGEYSALYAAGVFDAQTVISLAAYRGKAMEEAAQGHPSAMTAVMGLSRSLLQEACLESSVEGCVVIANYNCPGQMVIGGDHAAVERASELAKEKGAKRCIPLRVGGPFHTPLMEPASQALREKFQHITFHNPKIPVLFNCLGGPKKEEDSIAELLIEQVKSSVYMEDCIRHMASMDLDAVIEIGPGKTLSGFVKKIAPQLPVYTAETVEDVERISELLSQNAKENC